jgi:ankyrin repeat protein
MAEQYAWYGDTYPRNKKELGPYVELADGSVPGTMGFDLRKKKNYGHAVDYWESPFMDTWEKAMTHYLHRISSWLAAGDVHSAAQCAGTVSHWLADMGFPPHTPDEGDLEYIKDFFPPPEGFECFPLHGYIESLPPGPCSIADYKPRLLGLTPEQAASNMMDSLAFLVRSGRAMMVPLMHAVYSGRRDTIEVLLGQNVCDSARVLADFMHTAACLAAGRFDDLTIEQLKVLPLTWRWPYRMSAWAPHPYGDPATNAPLRLSGYNLNADQRRVRCELLVGTDGNVKSQPFDEALGAGAYFEYHYRAAAQMYSRFKAWVGIHATLGSQRNIDAEVRIDGQTAFNGVLIPGRAALEVDIDAHGCRDIQLISSGPQYFQPDGTNNHVVWAQPRLQR